MILEQDKVDVFLQPGDFHFSNHKTRIQTLLGSCIAISLWHPVKLIGGMCHYMLPFSKDSLDKKTLDGKYAEGAIELFLNEISAANTSPSEYHAKIFGGGNMFSEISSTKGCSTGKCNHQNIQTFSCKNIGCKNSLVAHHLVDKYGFQLEAHDVGGTQHRKVIFDISSGDVWLRKGS